MAISKIILNGVTQMDLTTDTVAQASHIVSPYVGHLNDGTVATGTASVGNDFIITLTYNSTTEQFEPDKTFAEITEAYQAGKTLATIASIYGDFCQSRCQYYIESNDAWLSYLISWSPEGGIYYTDSYSMDSNGISFDEREESVSPPNLQAKTNISPTTSSQTITADSGYDGLSSVQINAMPSGTVTAPSSISGSSATVSTGTNTLTLTKTVSVTPNVSTAGYVSSGTAGNSSVSLTASVTTKAAATITPGTSNQTIASGTYLTGTQTISGDANLVAGNIKSGVSIFGVAGSLAFSTITISSSNPSGGSNGDVWIKTS